MIQISGESAHLTQKGYFYQKATNKQSWKLYKVKFWPKPNIQSSAYLKPLKLGFQHDCLALHFYWKLKKCFEVLKNV